MPYTPVLATLGYVLSPDAQRVLLVRRDRRSGDIHFGKYNGVGGKLDAGEDVVAGFRREVREECGLECGALTLRGTINWPGFGKDGENWFGFIFRVDRWSGIPSIECAEGSLHWVQIERLVEFPLWEGDRHFLPLVFSRDSRQFHGVMPYRDGRPLSWTCSFLENRHPE